MLAVTHGGCLLTLCLPDQVGIQTDRDWMHHDTKNSRVSVTAHLSPVQLSDVSIGAGPSPAAAPPASPPAAAPASPPAASCSAPAMGASSSAFSSCSKIHSADMNQPHHPSPTCNDLVYSELSTLVVCLNNAQHCERTQSQFCRGAGQRSCVHCITPNLLNPSPSRSPWHRTAHVRPLGTEAGCALWSPTG